jgi:hypothetical protein
MSLISLPSTLLPVILPMASDDMMRPVTMNQAARTKIKYMVLVSYFFSLDWGYLSFEFGWEIAASAALKNWTTATQSFYTSSPERKNQKRKSQ